MLRSTRIRRNVKTLANLELAEALTQVSARRKAGVALHSALTSQTSLVKISQLPSWEVFKRIRVLLGE